MRILSLVIMLCIPLASVAHARPNDGHCDAVGQPVSSIPDKGECKDCGGTWVVPEMGCGGGVLGTTVGCTGALLGASIFGVVICIGGLYKTFLECKGKCEARVP